MAQAENITTKPAAHFPLPLRPHPLPLPCLHLRPANAMRNRSGSVGSGRQLTTGPKLLKGRN